MNTAVLETKPAASGLSNDTEWSDVVEHIGSYCVRRYKARGLTADEQAIIDEVLAPAGKLPAMAGCHAEWICGEYVVKLRGWLGSFRGSTPKEAAQQALRYFTERAPDPRNFAPVKGLHSCPGGCRH